MKIEISKVSALAAVLFYVTSVFQIADNHIILGVLFFVSGSCFATQAHLYSKKEKSEKES
ncbi:MAG: hypothetical protein E7302_13125 [Butyrivibrio sp.]|nr:hypothetical protein [Butyrivibrio sp.]